MRFALIFAAVLSSLIGSGCSHSKIRPQCPVAANHAESEVDVCIGSDRVKTGDRIGFFKTNCLPPSRGTPKKCQREKVGEGRVTKVLDEHLSSVRLESSFAIDDSTTIDRID